MAAPKGNTNAEKWTEEEALDFMRRSLMAMEKEPFDFIGELAQEMGKYRKLYNYLADKFPECKVILNKIEQECEANCFRHGKKGEIVPSLAIMNLKSNHGWTDRVASQNDNTNVNLNSEELTPEQIKALNDELNNEY